MSDFWINGTDGFFNKFNGCEHYDDCYSCPFNDCIMAAGKIREKRSNRGRKPKDVRPVDATYKQRWYEKNRERILAKQKEKRHEKNRRIEEAKLKGTSTMDLPQCT